jgi:xylulokinase
MHVLGLDIGTGGARCLVLRVDDGTIVSTASAPVELHHPHPGWSEQAPQDWWQAACSTIQEALRQANLSGDDIAAVGLTGQMHGCTLVDANDAPVGPAILWNDQRSEAQCVALLEQLDREQWIHRTGKPPLPGLTLPSLRWMQDEQPDRYGRAKHLLLPKDYLRLKLTGDYATDAGDASGTMLLDVHQRAWSDDLCTLANLDPALLPTIHEGTDVTGSVGASGAAATGLRVGTRVVAGGGDQQTGGVGCGIVSQGTVSLNLGTSGVLFAAMPEPARALPRGLHLFCHASKDLWHVMGVMLSAGGSLRWWRDICDLDYDALVNQAATDSDGVCFRPYLTGERTPHEDPNLRAGFEGLRLHHSRDVMTRAVLEGIAFGLRDGLSLIRTLQPVDHLRLTGGAAQSTLWRQLIADVMGCAVATINVDQGSAFGACMLAAVGIGAYPDLHQACDALVRETSMTLPVDANRMDEAYMRWSTQVMASGSASR